jgi:DNA mismatch endonuclease (patch repair protein)
MQRQGQRDTKHEVALRSLLHRRGLRFRTDYALPGLRRRADIVFPRLHFAIFSDGCFWHGCPEHGTWPKSNAAWWRDKIEANRERDSDTDRRLANEGWLVLRVWEHEPAESAAIRIEDVVRTRRVQIVKNDPPSGS